MNKKITTKFGIARFDGEYYMVNNKTLHKLIFEDFYGFEVPKGFVIHHKNRNKIDNCILNLQLLPVGEHIRLHRTGTKLSEETKEKIRQTRIGEKCVWWGKKHSIETRLKQSKFQNTTGFYGVNKHKKKDCTNGFYWEYLYYEDGKQRALCSVDFNKLKKKVKSKGKLWKVIDEDLAKITLKEAQGDI